MSDTTAEAKDDMNGRRKFLVAATSAMGAVGAVGVATPFIGSWNPSAKAKAAGAPVRVDVSKVGKVNKFVLNGAASLCLLCVAPLTTWGHWTHPMLWLLMLSQKCISSRLTLTV